MNRILTSNEIPAVKIFDFHGGIHPEENKQQTCHKGIKTASLPDEFIIPLQQHIGATAKAIVNVGDKVLKGQLIAEANGFVSAHVHAPTSGTIKAIEKRPVQHPSGLEGLCIVLESDHEDSWCQLNACEDFTKLSREQILEKIREAGISGMGGAGFPSSVKLNAKAEKISTLIVNSVECEPYITADDVLIRDSAQEILKGIEIVNQLFSPVEILIGIEDNKPEAIQAYENAIEASPMKHLKLAVVPTKYPSGGEKQLIELLTGKEVPAGGLPSDLGIICHNTGTLFAIYEAVVFGIPLIQRVTTLTGNALKDPRNYWTLIGTPFRHLLEQSQVQWNLLSQLIMGGPMMGFAVHDPEVPLVKTTNCILAAAAGELIPPEFEQPCIRCGSCAEVCPANLLPQQLYWYSKAKELEKAQDYHLSDCIECGACSYVCPSNIPLVQYFRFAKGESRNKQMELKKAELSRERFEARKERLEREEQEREAKRLAKAEARKQKQLEAKSAGIAGTTQSNNDALEIAFQLAKTNAAKASKQWKEAEKALEVARKNNAENIEELENTVAQLSEKAAQAQATFKQALDNKKAASEETPQAAISELDQKIEQVRESSANASNELKNLKKALLSAKTGTADTSELDQRVAEAREKSDQLKAELRDLLAQQKSEQPESVNNVQPAEQKVVETGNSEKDQLKIRMAQLKTQAKKLKAGLEEANDESRGEIEKLLQENQHQLNDVISKMTELEKG